MQEFAQWLWTLFPEDPQKLYQHEQEMPQVLTEEDEAANPPMICHISSFGFHEDASIKSFPGIDVFDELVPLYTVNGFSTSGQPIIAGGLLDGVTTCDSVFEPVKDTDIKPFTITYVKGLARMSSVLALLHHIYQHNLTKRFMQELPKLYESLHRVYVVYKPQNNKVDEALQIMTLSLAGSVRRKVNLIQLAMMMFTLANKYGMRDFTSFIRRWNQMNAARNQVVGKMAVALRLLFDNCSKVGLHLGEHSAFLYLWGYEVLQQTLSIFCMISKSSGKCGDFGSR